MMLCACNLPKSKYLQSKRIILPDRGLCNLTNLANKY